MKPRKPPPDHGLDQDTRDFIDAAAAMQRIAERWLADPTLPAALRKRIVRLSEKRRATVAEIDQHRARVGLPPYRPGRDGTPRPGPDDPIPREQPAATN